MQFWLRRRDQIRFQNQQSELKANFELALNQHEKLLTETQSIANLGSWEWDIQQDKIRWSAQMYKIFQVDPDNFDASYHAYLNRLAPEHRERIQNHVELARTLGQSYEFEHSVTHDEGQVRFIQSRGIAMRDANGTVTKLVGTCQDTTERKRIEEALVNSHSELESRVRERTHQLWEALERERAAKEAKINFLANMSHEIRTPMNAILGFSDLLLDSATDPEQKKLLLKIKTNGDHLLHLIDDILDLSKFEAGHIPVEKTNLHLPHLIQEAISAISGLAAKKSLHLDVVYETALPESIMTDGLRIRQILTNLLSNAIKFTDSGSVTVRVRQTEKPFSRASSLLSIDVEDTGIGISAADEEQLFQPFTQADSSGTRRFGGTGLGLALSRHIARALGGELILAHSRQGQGSCFRFTIEIGVVGTDLAQTRLELNAPTQTPALSNFDDPSNVLMPCRLLLAEDSPDNEELVRMYLNFPGVKIDSVSNGREAIDMALQNSYDVVLMDVQMPEVDGLQATRILRDRGYTRPIIALTAHAMKDDYDRSLRAGCSAHVTKPIQRQELIQIIQHELNGPPSRHLNPTSMVDL